MPIRVLHVVAHMGCGTLQNDLRLLLPRLQTPEVLAGVLTLGGESGGIAGLGALTRLVRSIHAFKPDVVHTHEGAAKYWALIAARLGGVKKIVHTERGSGGARGAAGRGRSCLAYALSRKVVACLPEHAREIAKICHVPHDKIAVIPKGLPVTPPVTPEERKAARAPFGIGAEQFLLLVAGGAEGAQHLELALQALAAIPPQTRSRIVMVMAGIQNAETVLRRLSMELGIAEQVRFCGERTDVETVLPAADIFVLTTFFEEMPVVLIKAMLAGVAIVTTPWLGSSTMLGNGSYGFITAGWDASDLACEIVRAMRGGGMRTALVQRAYAHACADYDIEHVAEAHRRLYRQICAAALPRA